MSPIDQKSLFLLVSDKGLTHINFSPGPIHVQLFTQFFWLRTTKYCGLGKHCQNVKTKLVYGGGGGGGGRDNQDYNQ